MKAYVHIAKYNFCGKMKVGILFLLFIRNSLENRTNHMYFLSSEMSAKCLLNCHRIFFWTKLLHILFDNS